MPYNTIAELPEAVQALPTTELKDAWRKAYNAAWQQYHDEAKAFATAWAQIEKMGWTKKGERWVKAERFVKDILYPGKMPHPNKPNETLEIDAEMIDKLAYYTTLYLQKGGKIPATMSHPHSEQEKVSEVHGWLFKVWKDGATNILQTEMDLDAEATEWVVTKKLRSVSPGILYNAVTSLGKFPLLIDHVALTNSPHLVEQGEFIPITAESYSASLIGFEGGKGGFYYYQAQQGYECECIECGYKMTTEGEHCADIKCPKCGGQMRRAERPGPGQPNLEGGLMDEVLKLLKGIGHMLQEMRGDVAELFGREDQDSESLRLSNGANYACNLDVGYLKGVAKNDGAGWAWNWAKDGDAIVEKGGYELLNKVTCLKDKDADPETKEAYAYPVAKLVGGKMTLFWGGVRAAMQRIHQQANMGKLDKAVAKSAHGKLAQLYGLFDKEPPEFAQHKEADEMKELEELKQKVATLETQLADANKEKDGLTKERDDLKTQLDKIAASRADGEKQSFEARLGKAIESGRVMPAEKENLVVLFERLHESGNTIKAKDDDGKEIDQSVEDFILTPYEARPSVLQVQLAGALDKIRVNKVTFDMTKLEDRNKLSDLIAARAASEGKSYTETKKAMLLEAGVAAEQIALL